MSQKYSVNKAVGDALRHATTIGVNEDSIKALYDAQQFYHKYSHPSLHSIGAGASFSSCDLFVGASFDRAKMKIYTKEMQGRVSLAEVFSNFIDAVKANVAKW